MPRLIVYLVLVIAAVWLWKRWQRAVSAVQAARGGAPRSNSRQLSERMVPCAECGVFSPASQAIGAAGHAFCCGEHADRYLERQRAAHR